MKLYLFSVPCNPNHQTWVDVHGTNCEGYVTGWCTSDGQKGPNWTLFDMGEWSFKDYANNGFDALSCPQCGCGGHPEQSDETNDEEEKPKDQIEEALSQLTSSNDDFEDILTGKLGETSFAKNSIRQVENVTRRMREKFTKFGCDLVTTNASDVRSDLQPCQKLDQVQSEI